MGTPTLSQMRAEVIEKFINLETIINAIICQHYFKRVYKQFFLEVLYNEHCTFGLKRSILEKIIPNLDKTQLQNLNRLNTIRNYFAHTGPEMFEGAEIPSKGQQGVVPDPRKMAKALDYSQLHQEFQKLEPTVARYLFKLYQELGGEYVKG
jgi:hypothetical protein